MNYVDPFLEIYNLTVQCKPSSLTSNANLTKFQPTLNWTSNNRTFPAFSIPCHIPAWLTPSPLQWITTHMNTAFPSIPLWVHRLPKKIGHRESFEGDSDKRAEDTWTLSYQKFLPWWSFSSRTPTSQSATMCSVKYKEHRWAVNLHRHYADLLQLFKNTVSSRHFKEWRPSIGCCTIPAMWTIVSWCTSQNGDNINHGIHSQNSIFTIHQFF